MTDTEVSWRILGHAYPQHFNKVVAETMWKNIEKVGLPQWSEADQKLAKALQKELGVKEEGLKTELGKLEEPEPEERRMGGGSDDIGDITWVVPTVTLRFPSNIPGGPGHHWANAIAMATPIAHKGATAGAKVMVMTALDFFTSPELVQQAWDYFRTSDEGPPVHAVHPRTIRRRSSTRSVWILPRGCGSTTTTRRSTTTTRAARLLIPRCGGPNQEP
jgi:aminobenzoyl-glutamate utilization protein B